MVLGRWPSSVLPLDIAVPTAIGRARHLAAIIAAMMNTLEIDKRAMFYYRRRVSRLQIGLSESILLRGFEVLYRSPRSGRTRQDVGEH
jgi:hypothetical protein